MRKRKKERDEKREREREREQEIEREKEKKKERNYTKLHHSISGCCGYNCMGNIKEGRDSNW
jgi:hypothetical protein